MNLWQSFLEAMESLSSNKMRSSLTILGIVIGVAAVIAMVSIGRGAQASITGSIQGIGTNLLFVMQREHVGDRAQPQAPHLAGLRKPSMTPSPPPTWWASRRSSRTALRCLTGVRARSPALTGLPPTTRECATIPSPRASLSARSTCWVGRR